MESWARPAVPRLPGRGRPLRLTDTATGEVRPTAPGRDRPDVRLRHHAVRRDPPRPRGDLPGLRPGPAGLAGRRPRRALRAERDRRRRPAAGAGRARRRGLGRAGASGRPSCSATDMAALRVLPPADFVGAVEAIPRDRAAGAAPARRPARRTCSTTTSTSPSSPRRGSATSPGWTSRRCWRCPPSAAATRSGRARRTRSTRCCGGRPGPASRAGTRRSAPAGRAGTWSARRSRCSRLRDGLRRAGRRQRPRLPAPRDVGRARRGGDRRVAVRPGVRARRDGRAATARRCPRARATWCSCPAARSRAPTRPRCGWRCWARTTGPTATGPRRRWSRRPARLARWRAAVALPAGPARRRCSTGSASGSPTTWTRRPR